MAALRLPQQRQNKDRERERGEKKAHKWFFYSVQNKPVFCMTSLTCLKPFFLGSAGEQAFGIRPSLLTLSGRFSVVAETGSVSYSPNKNHCRRHCVSAQVVAAALALNCLYRLQVRGEGGRKKRSESLKKKKSSAGIRMLVVRLHHSSKSVVLLWTSSI